MRRQVAEVLIDLLGGTDLVGRHPLELANIILKGLSLAGLVIVNEDALRAMARGEYEEIE